MRNLKLGFIGLGLIGGSIAKAAKQIHENITIIAYNRSEKSRILAQNDHVADIVTDTIDEYPLSYCFKRFDSSNMYHY